MSPTITRLTKWFRFSQKATTPSVVDFGKAPVGSTVACGGTTLPPAAVKPDMFAERLSIEMDGDIESSPLAASVALSFRRALMLDVELPQDLLELEGMSGRKYRLFINELLRNIERPRYLEIGSWMGSTVCSAIYKNSATVACVDNWSEFGGPRDLFFENIKKYMNSNINLAVIERDFRLVDYLKLGRFGVFLFDGPHGHEDQYLGVSLTLGALDDEFILIVDDWNAPFVRVGTMNAIRELPLECLYKIIIRTTQNDKHATVARQASDWHNGYFIAVYRKLDAGDRADPLR